MTGFHLPPIIASASSTPHENSRRSFDFIDSPPGQLYGTPNADRLYQMSTPTLFEWLGGASRLQQLVDVFYRRVADDALLAPVFRNMSPEHARHVAAFVAEVFGGPKTYSEQHGGHPAMIRKHLGRALTEPQRRRWMDLLLSCADEVGMPTDPEFRSAFVA